MHQVLPAPPKDASGIGAPFLFYLKQEKSKSGLATKSKHGLPCHDSCPSCVPHGPCVPPPLVALRWVPGRVVGWLGAQEEGWQWPGPPRRATQGVCWPAWPCMPDTSADRCSPVVPSHHEPPHNVTQGKKQKLLLLPSKVRFSSVMQEGRMKVMHGGHEWTHVLHPPSPSLILPYPLNWEAVG